jgi:4'-phosphopantetheinyl transferase
VERGQIHVWRAHLPAELTSSVRDALSDAEVRYAERMTSEVARRQFLGAQAALRIALSLYLDEEPGLIRFRRGEHGKPFLTDDHASDLQFNLTHSHDLALAAVTRTDEIGIDLEKVRSRPRAERLAARFFAEAEQAGLAALPAEQRERGFFRLWTRKESHIKATGTGLSVNLRAIDTLAPAGKWWYREFEPAEDYVASLAGKGPLDRIAYFDLPQR